MRRATVAKGDLCHVCGRAFPADELRPWVAVRPGVSALIEAESPGWCDGAFICQADLARKRRLYVERMLEDERGEIGALDKVVLDSIESGSILSRHLDSAVDEKITFGERMADRVAVFGGSWTFILIFLSVLLVWIAINLAGLLGAAFDPYPFILLNLVLSCVAALQAPVIMMSQRRQETKDRLRGENDYRVNLKAELEIRQLHEKLDHQLVHQWQRLVEMQQIQIEMLEERGRDGR
ncbi:MAG: DUF1003 domain-containing protein [Gemmobacter sp.]|nr:DUF1003 domain-containing protein [Gemmobacter sp.]